MLLLLLAALVACGPGSPEEKVTQTRAQYSVQLNGWFPKAVEEPAYEPMDGEMTDEEMTDGETADGEAEAEASDEAATEDVGAEGEAVEGEAVEGEAVEGEPMAEAAPAPTTIVFDLIVLFSGKEPLPGITVDLTQADADGNEKKTWREFLDIPSIVKAETKQLTLESEVDFAEGDQFSVQLLKYVDPANYSEYHEYAEAGSGN